MRVAEIALQTPDSRNRYIDLLRVVAIAAVVLGHYFLSVITRDGDGGLNAVNILGIAPWTQYLTWIVQVMPVFFIVGGWSNKASWESARRRGRSYADWVRGRAVRLLRPTMVFIGAWFGLGMVLGQIVDATILDVAGRTVAAPLWFLSVYLLVVAAAPLMLELHYRFGTAASLMLIAPVAVVDGLHHIADVPLVGFLNYGLVWLAIHQLGYLWHDERITSRIAAAMATGGLATVVALSAVGPYPISMVGVPGEAMSNTSPPTVVLVALGVFQAGALLLLEQPARRWLQGPKVWKAVIVGNANIMTIYLWHFTALVIVAAGLYLFPLMPDVARLSPQWWVLHGVEIVAYLVGLVPLVLLFGRFERTTARIAGPSGSVAAIIGVGLSSAAFALFAAGGLSATDAFGGIPWQATALGLAGLALLGASSVRSQ